MRRKAIISARDFSDMLEESIAMDRDNMLLREASWGMDTLNKGVNWFKGKFGRTGTDDVNYPQDDEEDDDFQIGDQSWSPDAENDEYEVVPDDEEDGSNDIAAQIGDNAAEAVEDSENTSNPITQDDINGAIVNLKNLMTTFKEFDARRMFEGPSTKACYTRFMEEAGLLYRAMNLAKGRIVRAMNVANRRAQRQTPNINGDMGTDIGNGAVNSGNTSYTSYNAPRMGAKGYGRNAYSVGSKPYRPGLGSTSAFESRRSNRPVINENRRYQSRNRLDETIDRAVMMSLMRNLH